MAGRVEQQIAGAYFGRAQGLRTAQERAQAGEELFEIEGLGEVIVGARIEAGDAVVDGAASGEHQDGGAKSGGTQFGANGVAVFHGDHHVEHDQIVVGYGCEVERLLAIGRDVDGVGLFAQAFGDEAGYPRFVFHQENSHTSLSCDFTNDLHGFHTPPTTIGIGTHLASAPILGEVPATRDLTWYAVEACERLASTVLLAALAPVVLACAAAVAWASGRSPFIAHRRVGWRGETLWMIKLRTMWDGKPAGSRTWVERIGGEAQAQKEADDPRIGNGFARFCRRHSIDEIPQLWHVARGEMSLVGPRPLTRGELDQHYGRDSDELLRVRPGLAGLWQISGRNHLTYRQRKELDLRYVRERSVGLYLRILARTIPEVVRGANSW
jgi:exopolysaccharide production protein ExoY